jgi:hypothetical protein
MDWVLAKTKEVRDSLDAVRGFIDDFIQILNKFCRKQGHSLKKSKDILNSTGGRQSSENFKANPRKNEVLTARLRQITSSVDERALSQPKHLRSICDTLKKHGYTKEDTEEADGFLMPKKPLHAVHKNYKLSLSALSQSHTRSQAWPTNLKNFKNPKGGRVNLLSKERVSQAKPGLLSDLKARRPIKKPNSPFTSVSARNRSISPHQIEIITNQHSYRQKKPQNLDVNPRSIRGKKFGNKTLNDGELSSCGKDKRLLGKPIPKFAGNIYVKPTASEKMDHQRNMKKNRPATGEKLEAVIELMKTRQANH